ncbi:hypothetical protein QWZ16_09070 [Vibrio ostreicida]|uniref:DUF3265 domain-containing protein n=1 Tax=Vibrio ostreicida TaxID=526588 RepID=A0ABT8BUP8_9VIBR|nr:hypothetical protein [Vibrio ostreicida]MDN3609847.1 hypothetical protein [Vibrio ostreicida]
MLTIYENATKEKAERQKKAYFLSPNIWAAILSTICPHTVA